MVIRAIIAAAMTYVIDWLELLVRWAHLIFGAAWIGTSFYFNWLNNHIRKPEHDDGLTGTGIDGQLWSIHGGHFYRVLKYEVAPAQLPKTLHWFKWEAYTTWLSGFALFVFLYYARADTALVDRAVADLSQATAILLSVLLLVAAWVVYDVACRLLRGRELLLAFVLVSRFDGDRNGNTESANAGFGVLSLEGTSACVPRCALPQGSCSAATLCPR